MRPLVALLAFIIIVPQLSADDLKLINGKEYNGVTVTKVEPDGITVMTNSGVEKLYFAWLPKAVQQKYGYNSTVAAAYSAQEAAVQHAVYRAQMQEDKTAADAIQVAQRVQDQARIEANHPRERIIGNVRQIISEGILVEYRLDVDWVANGGNVTLARSSHNRPSIIQKFGEYFLVGHPNQGALVDGDGIDVDVVSEGNYTTGAGQTVAKFKVVKAYPDPFK